MTGATGRAVMAASRAGGGGAAGSRGGREDRPPGACSSAGRFGEIAPVFVSEGGLEPRSWWYIPKRGIHHHSKLTRQGSAGPAFRRRKEAAAPACPTGPGM